jgi:Orotate phosphoribosyltransferase
MDYVSVKKGEGKVVIVDDVLASGGMLMVVNEVCEEAGYEVLENLVLIDLEYVLRVVKNWVKKNRDFDLEVKSLISYE